ncbi:MULTISPECIES: SLAC1 family transporter [Streptomyces]|nr:MULTISPECIES: hypothetical protein [Streptomyces]MYS99059.1 hypothetical protein [Streptomyces sp. SID5469]OOV32638.1 hypothetical protein SM007_07425 [Streptomyces avermitilis]
MPGTPQPRTWWAPLPPADGAAVMATGVVSVGLHLTGHEVLSRIALVAAGAAWLALAADFTVRLLRERERWAAEAGTPAALTAVAATAVLGTRLSALGWQGLAEALLALAAALWPGLLFLVVRRWERHMPGVVLLACVATQGLALLGATLAADLGVAWLAHTALVFFWLGLVLYAVALWRFDLRQVAEGAGDHWIAGGALALSALAGAQLVAARRSGGPYLWNDDDNGVLRTVTAALLVLALGWYCVLWAAELRWPRPAYDVRRWATVFPMAMTAVAVLSVAIVLGVPWLWGPGQVLLWIAVAVWPAVCAAAVVDIRSRAPR